MVPPLAGGHRAAKASTPHRPALNRLWTGARRDFGFLKQTLVDSFRLVPPPPHVPDPAGWHAEGITLSWLGHATMLMKINGVTVLTDPALGKRIGPALGPFVFGPKRFVRAPLEPSRLPAIDLVLITHAHMDHLDLYTLRRLKRAKRIVTAENTADVLRKLARIEVVEISNGNEIEFAGPPPLRLMAFPVNHPSARWRRDTHRTCSGYLISSGGYHVAFIGDTAHAEHFERCLPRHIRPDIAIVPIGCYDPYIWNHCTPEQALEIAAMMRAEAVLPIHHSTFKLSREAPAAPLRRFVDAGAQFNLKKATLAIGETYRIFRDAVER